MEWSPFSAWYGIAAVIAVGFLLLCWRTLRSSNGPSLGRRVSWLVLRGCILALLLLVLLHPHRVERKEFREPREIAVLVDDSASISLRDEEDGPSRFERAKEDLESLSSLYGEEGQLRWYRFDKDAFPIAGGDQLTTSGNRSDIGRALETVLGDEEERELSAIVLLSDGQTDDPEAAIRAARLCQQANIPLYTRLLGTPDESADLRLSGLFARQESLYNPKVLLSGKIHAAGFVGERVDIRVSAKDRLLHEATEMIGANEQLFEFAFETPYKGFHTYDIEILPIGGERLTDNNSGVVGAEVLDRKIRVINMEGTPRASHDLENAVETDPDIEVTSLFFPQASSFEASRKIPFTIDANGRKVYNIAHPVKGYPKTLEEMLTYDVIINSDIFKEAFTPEQLDLTVALVEEHGGGFVMVGGSTAFGAGNYDETVIDKLMPVDVYDNEETKWGSFGLKVPRESLTHPIMTMGPTVEDSAKVWNEVFPGFSGLNTVNRAKPGAKVLAFNAEVSNEYGPLVVFAVQQIGRGRTMAFTSDTTQAWGSRFSTRFGTAEDPLLYYRRFWIQSIRWLAADRIQRKSGELKVIPDRWELVPSEAVEIRIPFPQSDPDAMITLQRESAGSEPAPVDLVRDELEGVWRSVVMLETPGEWIFTARMPRKDLDPLFARALVHVTADTRELDSTAADEELMAKLAELGGGQLLVGEAETWAVSVDADGSRIIEYGRQAAWDRWWVMGLFLLLLTVEWSLRRRWISSPGATWSPP